MMNKELLANSVNELDLTKAEHLDLVQNKTDLLLQHYSTLAELMGMEAEMTQRPEDFPILIKVALKIAKSKILIGDIEEKLKVSVVFAAYKEHNRIKTSDEHPHGEDFLVRKVNQMKTLVGDKPNITWELIMVDDGCPEGSGTIANEIIQKENLGEHCKVLFLQNAIEDGLPVVEGLNSTNDSQKGGSVEYGMWQAAMNSEEKNHIIVFTDADLSTHLGQLGLLLDPILNKNKQAAIASRRETNSVVVKQSARNNRGKLFIYIWKRLIPELHYLIDTQCGFKAFKKEIILSICEDTIEKKFAFDIELLLRTELAHKNSIEKVGTAWIDSESASTTTDIQPYLPMLKSIAEMYKTYLPSNQTSDDFADFVGGMDEKMWIQLLDNIPEEISSREPIAFADYAGVSVADLKDCLT